MRANALKRNYNRIIRQHGESMTLTRSSEGTTITLKGKRTLGGTESLGNTAEQQLFRVRIGLRELAASAWAVKVPNATGDTLTVGGRVRAILNVQPLSDGATVAGYALEVEG